MGSTCGLAQRPTIGERTGHPFVQPRTNGPKPIAKRVYCKEQGTAITRTADAEPIRGVPVIGRRPQRMAHLLPYTLQAKASTGSKKLNPDAEGRSGMTPAPQEITYITAPRR